MVARFPAPDRSFRGISDNCPESLVNNLKRVVEKNCKNLSRFDFFPENQKVRNSRDFPVYFRLSQNFKIFQSPVKKRSKSDYLRSWDFS